jgi:hypothetical protein
MHTTPPYRTLPRAAGCTSPCTRRTQAATLNCSHIPYRGWQAAEAVANLRLRLAVRVHYGHQACARRVPGYSSGTTLRVLYGALGVL